MKQFRIVLTPAKLKALREFVYARDRWRCRHCKTRNNLHAHHVVYRSQGGDDASYNLITLCSRFDEGGCHEAVHRNDLVIYNPLDHAAPVDADLKVVFGRRNGWTPQ